MEGFSCLSAVMGTRLGQGAATQRGGWGPRGHRMEALGGRGDSRVPLDISRPMIDNETGWRESGRREVSSSLTGLFSISYLLFWQGSSSRGFPSPWQTETTTLTPSVGEGSTRFWVSTGVAMRQ